MTGAKVSVVVPVYNGANYVREAIESALAQTYRPLEVIVVNDASTDQGATDAIVRSFGDRVRYFQLPVNGGVARALNHGIRHMTGEWFVWLSHDDVLAPTRVEEDIERLRTIPDAKITFSRLMIIDGSGGTVKELEYAFDRVTNLYEVFANSGVNFCSMTVHRSCFDAVGLFNEQNRTTQDVEMALRLARRYVFYNSPKGITYSRDHGERGTYALSQQRREGVAMLCRFVRDELGFREFFPRAIGDRKAIQDGWLWLSYLHRGFQQDQYSRECERLAALSQKSPLLAWLTTFARPARVLARPSFERLEQLASYTARRVWRGRRSAERRAPTHSI
jgi:glycosyltransferase involved in cell wall biosynthesis